MQFLAKEHDFEWRFCLPFSPQEAMLIERKHRMLNQEIKFLTGKTALTRWNNTVSGFNTFEWSTSKACYFITQTWDRCWGIQPCKGIDITRNSHCPDSYCGSMYYAAENTKPYHAWERCYLPEFAMRCSIRMCELFCIPGWGETA